MHDLGVDSAYIYGDTTRGGTGGIDGLNAFFILTDEPNVYNLPDQPELPQDKTLSAMATTVAAAVAFGVAAFFSLRGK